MKFALKMYAGKAKPHAQMMVLAADLPMLWGVDLPGVMPTTRSVHARAFTQPLACVAMDIGALLCTHLNTRAKRSGSER